MTIARHAFSSEKVFSGAAVYVRGSSISSDAVCAVSRWALAYNHHCTATTRSHGIQKLNRARDTYKQSDRRGPRRWRRPLLPFTYSRVKLRWWGLVPIAFTNNTQTAENIALTRMHERKLHTKTGLGIWQLPSMCCRRSKLTSVAKRYIALAIPRLVSVWISLNVSKL